MFRHMSDIPAVTVDAGVGQMAITVNDSRWRLDIELNWGVIQVIEFSRGHRPFKNSGIQTKGQKDKQKSI